MGLLVFHAGCVDAVVTPSPEDRECSDLGLTADVVVATQGTLCLAHSVQLLRFDSRWHRRRLKLHEAYLSAELARVENVHCGSTDSPAELARSRWSHGWECFPSPAENKEKRRGRTPGGDHPAGGGVLGMNLLSPFLPPPLYLSARLWCRYFVYLIHFRPGVESVTNSTE